MGSQSDNYTVEQELVIPTEAHLLPPMPQLVKLAGFAESEPPERLLLAQVVFTGGRYGGRWHVDATIGQEIIGSIWCDQGVERDQVIEILDAWVRNSAHVTFVPGRAYEVPVEAGDMAYFFCGVVLARGDRI